MRLCTGPIFHIGIAGDGGPSSDLDGDVKASIGPVAQQTAVRFDLDQIWYLVLDYDYCLWPHGPPNNETIHVHSGEEVTLALSLDELADAKRTLPLARDTPEAGTFLFCLLD